MIVKKGLQSGDVFSDGDREFLVFGVRADGSYLSRQILVVPPEVTPPEAAQPEVTPPVEPQPESAALKCDECGKQCANASGLAVHKRAAHKSADID